MNASSSSMTEGNWKPSLTPIHSWLFKCNGYGDLTEVFLIKIIVHDLISWIR